MNEIPEDVMLAARATFGRLPVWFTATVNYTAKSKAINEIARAILAERERCAAYIRSIYRDEEGEALRARFIVPEVEEGYLEAWHQASDVADAVMNPYPAALSPAGEK